MPVVITDTYGPKPSMELLGGSASTLAAPSAPLLPGGRSITMLGGGVPRLVSYARLYRTQPWIGTACKRGAGAIARLGLQVNRFLDDAGDTRERDRNHPAAKLIAQPRPLRRGFHLRWDIALSLFVHGNWIGWKRRPSRGAPPRELWTLDWRALVPILDGDRVIAWRWTGTGIPGLERGQIIFPEDVVHLAFGGPGGGDIGVSPLEQLGVTIRSEDALQRYSEAALRNGTRFGAAAILDKGVKADKVVRDGVREELMDAHGGVDQAFKPAILGGGVVDLKPLGSQSAVEAELIAQRKVNREEIAAVIGLPGAVIGILDEAKYSALRELHRMLYVTSLGEPLGLIGESLQAQLIDPEPAWQRGDLAGRFLEWNLDEVLKGDAKERWETYGLALDHGGLTLNDVRRKENLKPYDDPRADEPLIAANNVRPLSAVGAAGTNVLDGNPIDAALKRAQAAIADGANGLEALDRTALEGELVAGFERLGLNGSSAELAASLAGELEDLVTDLQGAPA